MGNTYLERGEPVEVMAAWAIGQPVADHVHVLRHTDAQPVQITICIEAGKRVRGPRNVLIRRGNGELVVRPFRGLRRVTS